MSKNYKPKYSLLKNKLTGIRAIRIEQTEELVSEAIDPARYKELRAKAVKNLQKRAKDDALESLGLVKVKGALGGTYWE